jgi:hypothetical protein
MVLLHETEVKSVTRAKPCAVCGDHRRCSYTNDGFILCRVKDGAQPGFVYLGQAKNDPAWAQYRREGDPLLEGDGHYKSSSPPVDWEAELARQEKSLTPRARKDLAETLGLPEAALAALRIGYLPKDKYGPCWTFPECDATGRLTGILRRYREKPSWSDTNKIAMPGGKRGLIIPEGWRQPGPLYCPEGPSDVLALTAMHLAAIGRPSNFGGKDFLAELLRQAPADRPIVVLGERDPKENGLWPGLEGAKSTAAELAKQFKARKISCSFPPGKAKDVRAWVLAQNPDPHCPDLWHDLGERFQAGLVPIKQEMGRENPRTQGDILAELAEGAELFHGPEGTPFATVLVSQSGQAHQMTAAVSSTDFRSWLTGRYYARTGKAPGSQVLQENLDLLKARAQFDGPCKEVFCRVGPGPDNTIFLDLGSADWKTVKISAAGWGVVRDCPVKFRRFRSMLALPEPAGGGSLEDLQPFVNSGEGEEGNMRWRLLVAWLVAATRPTGPYPVLALAGEQGSAKSTTARVLRCLIDPNAVPLRTAPRDVRDLMIMAANSRTVVLDNLSHLQNWLSDALCNLSTGGGFSTRQLFTDSDEMVLEAMRPVAITGIEDLATRGDLLDRSLALNLPVIPEKRRQTEAEFWTAFEAVRPKILGALLTATAAALKNLSGVRLNEPPRMADFATWVCAAEPALPWRPGQFLEAYSGNRTAINDLALEASPVYEPLCKYLENCPFEGKASQLLENLTAIAGEKVIQSGSWPRSPRALGGCLRRLAPNLRKAGFTVDLPTKGGRVGRIIFLKGPPELPE